MPFGSEISGRSDTGSWLVGTGRRAASSGGRTGFTPPTLTAGGLRSSRPSPMGRPNAFPRPENTLFMACSSSKQNRSRGVWPFLEGAGGGASLPNRFGDSSFSFRTQHSGEGSAFQGALDFLWDKFLSLGMVAGSPCSTLNCPTSRGGRGGPGPEGLEGSGVG